ncbi:MAG: FAD-dependent oxidoreductase [Clostridium sp.]|nr:FAD-dependent oxidoreductase [Clostridium sp.]
MDYDVIIMGGGIVGCAAAYELCKYNLNVAVIEKNFDVAEDVALLNSSLISDGKDLDNEKIFKRTVESKNYLENLSSELEFFYEKVPSITVYENKKEAERIYTRAIKRKIEGLTLLEGNKANKINHNINKDECAILSENTAVISPYDYATSMAEIAYDNGVSFKLEEEVIEVKKQPRNGYYIVTDKSRYSSRVVIKTNYALKSDLKTKSELDMPSEEMLIENMLIEKDFNKEIKHIIKKRRKNGEVILLLPNSTNKLLVYLKTNEFKEFSEMKKEVESVIGPFPAERIDTLNESIFWNKEISINLVDNEPDYISINAKNYNSDTILPSLIKETMDKVGDILKLTVNKDFINKKRKYYKFKEITDEERNEIINIDPKYGNMICLCSNVTEGEIVDSIRRPLGARTIEGVRRRTGIINGRCQGSYCLTKITSILARELHISPMDVINDKKDSEVIASRIKEFDSI